MCLDESTPIGCFKGSTVLGRDEFTRFGLCLLSGMGCNETIGDLVGVLRCLDRYLLVFAGVFWRSVCIGIIQVLEMTTKYKTESIQ